MISMKLLSGFTDYSFSVGGLSLLNRQQRQGEFRFRDGNSIWFPYNWLGSWQHNPSEGLLLKFTGDVVTLVLIRGSNLDAPVGQAQVNLTDRGLQRHRIVFVREMDEAELRRRIRAACLYHNIDESELDGWVYYWTPRDLHLIEVDQYRQAFTASSAR